MGCICNAHSLRDKDLIIQSSSPERMPSSQARRERRVAAGVSSGRAPAAATPSSEDAGGPQEQKRKRAEAADITDAAGAAAKPKKTTGQRLGDMTPDEQPATAWDEDAPGDGDVEGTAAASTAAPAPTKQGGAARISCTVFVGQLPYSAGEAEIRRFFKAGGVSGGVRVRLLTQRDGSSKGMAFVELDSEADVHTSLRLHKAPMEGRRINVERTVGGGGDKERRREKLADLRQRQGSQMRATLDAMIEAILPAPPTDSDEGGGGGGGYEEDEEGWGAPAVHRGDLDERVLEFLISVPLPMAESALREAKALGMGGIRNRPAYLMGVLKRRVEEEDHAAKEKVRAIKDRAKRRDGKAAAAGDGGDGGDGDDGDDGDGKGRPTAKKRKREGKDWEEEVTGEATAPVTKPRKAKKPTVGVGELDDVEKAESKKGAKKAKVAAESASEGNGGGEGREKKKVKKAKP